LPIGLARNLGYLVANYMSSINLDLMAPGLSALATQDNLVDYRS